MMLRAEPQLSSAAFRKTKRARFDNSVSEAPSPPCLESHPHGVLPLGNRWSTTSASPTPTTLHLQSKCCDEECWTAILSFLTPKELCVTSAVCRYLYVLSSQPELWRDAVLLEKDSLDHFRQTWQTTWQEITLQTTAAVERRSPNVKGTKEGLVSFQPLKIAGIYSDYLFRQHSCRTFSIPDFWMPGMTSQRIHSIDELFGSSLCCNKFRNNYEEMNIPVVLKGAAKSWPACTKWKDASYLSEILGSRRTLRATSGTAQQAAHFTWSSYIQYCKATAIEEGPLYLFDNKAALLGPLAADCPWQQDHHDYFRHLQSERPDHTWLIAGPARSGSVFHIDPNATHAWNACIVGKKRWILSPPGIPPPGVRPQPDGDMVLLPVSLGEWMHQFYNNGRHGLWECTVEPGDIMFVPHGWWHMVVNLDAPVNIAVTHNYVAPNNLPNVLRFLREKPEQVSGIAKDKLPEKLYEQFVDAMQQNEPQQLKKALECTDWTCKAWSTTSKNSMKANTNVMEQAKTEGNGFTFSFL